MERFKAIEKEMKTKAFSKEGLNLAAKVDPKEREKSECCTWISNQVEDLTVQIDKFEAEVEVIRLNSKKNKRDTGNKDRIAHLEHMVERHKWHIGRLELTLRLLENDNLTSDQVNDIKEDVEYYISNNQVYIELLFIV